ncbi:acyl-CoA dehydratase activase [candidate division KSB1 bacterium]
MIKAGIDVGSRTTKVVILENNKVISKYILPTGWDPERAAKECFNEALNIAGIKENDVEQITATGYGRVLLPFAHKTVTEITCHAKGAFFTDPDIKTIIDIGGQDSKVIKINGYGLVEDFAMNDRCAAGTGKFIEFLAHSINIEVSEFGKIALKSSSPATISSMCTVFAESEVLSLVSENVPVEDIIAGIHLSIARRIETMIYTIGFSEKVAITGGVAHNAGIKHQLEQLLGVEIIIPEYPEFIGALGAALVE